jgi:uracil-DNA glycosylase
MAQTYIFPFGQELKNVVQKDTTQKKVFVLGVYASAVHAKWLDNNGKTKIKALAVASEPCIFWKGDPKETEKIISKINIPQEYGKLSPADSTFNGPSGRSLDENYLIPFHLTRNDAWLCDLVPYSCKNSGQDSALKREYDKFINLPKYSIPEVPKILATQERINVILQELKKSQADTIILLGDQPIKYFISKFTNNKYNKLSDFEEYGKPINVIIDGKTYIVFAFAHPRQTSNLGKSSKKWFDLHEKWKIEMLNNK